MQCVYDFFFSSLASVPPCLGAQKKVSGLKWGKPSNVGHVHRHAGTGAEWGLLSESWKWRKTDLGGGIMSWSQCQHSESTALVFKCQKGSRSPGPHIWISLKREVYKIKCFVSDGCVTSAQTPWGSEWTGTFSLGSQRQFSELGLSRYCIFTSDRVPIFQLLISAQTDINLISVPYRSCTLLLFIS